MLAGVAIMLSVGTANADEDDARGLFIGLGLESFNLDAAGTGDNGTSYDINTKPLGAVARVGFYLFPWLSLDVHGSTGIHDADNDGSVGGGQSVHSGDTELKYLYGVGVKPQWQFSSGLSVFALGGYSKFKFEGKARDDTGLTPQSTSFTVDDDGGYYGGGIQIDGEAGSFIFQYTKYFDDNNVQLEGFQLSVNKYF